MDRDDVTGVWSITGNRKWLGRYYRYRVEVWHPAAQRIVTTSVTDPYSLRSGRRLDAQPAGRPVRTRHCMPPGWDDLVKPTAVAPARMQIAEVSRPRLLDLRRHGAGRPSGAPTWRSPEPSRPACGTCGRSPTPGSPTLHLLPAFDFATVAGPPRRPGRARLRPGRAAAGFAGAAACGAWRSPTPTASTGVTTRCTTPRRRAVCRRAGRPGPDPRIPADGRRAQRRRPPGGHGRRLQPHDGRRAGPTFSVLDRIVPGYYHRLLGDGRSPSPPAARTPRPST